MYGCTEETVLIEADIPAVPGFVWLADCNTLVISRELDEVARQRAIDDLQTTWRREWLRPVA